MVLFISIRFYYFICCSFIPLDSVNESGSDSELNDRQFVNFFSFSLRVLGSHFSFNFNLFQYGFCLGSKFGVRVDKPFGSVSKCR